MVTHTGLSQPAKISDNHLGPRYKPNYGQISPFMYRNAIKNQT